MKIEASYSRRDFIKCLGMVGMAAFSGRYAFASNKPARPNIILCMCDDLGWGDVGYHRTNTEIKTPHLDQMAKTSMQFGRFYAGAPVCSPTRGSVLTGRNPYRYGITTANDGFLKDQEITIAEAIKPLGYRTGHFGKWHLGTMTTEIKDSNRGVSGRQDNFFPPWRNGFDVCFSTEAKVPTWNPMYEPGTENFYGTHYWKQDGSFVPYDAPELKGDDSRIIMDHAAAFIEDSVKQKKPFLAVIWFHTPHKPYLAGPEYKALYKTLSGEKQNYYGCITAMDEQVGRLRRQLKELGVSKDTQLWFTSDNGPEVGTPGTAGGFRERKRSLYEGGIRVPGLLEWPAVVKKHRLTDMPCCTSDYFPTVMDILGFSVPGQPKPIDGISLAGLIYEKMERRSLPIGFQYLEQRSLIDNQYKLYSPDKGNTYELYNLKEDPFEKKDIAASNPAIAVSMKKELEKWIESCQRSNAGEDYPKVEILIGDDDA
jgi:arylsulfatase A-like enzyme